MLKVSWRTLKAIFQFLPLEIHFWSVPEAKSAVHPNSYTKGKRHPILNFQWLVWWNSKSFFSLFPLEIYFWGMPEVKNAVQPNSQRGRGISFWIFSDQFDGIPIAGWLSACKKNITTHTSQICLHQLLATPLLLD